LFCSTRPDPSNPVTEPRTKNVSTAQVTITSVTSAPSKVPAAFATAHVSAASVGGWAMDTK